MSLGTNGITRWERPFCYIGLIIRGYRGITALWPTPLPDRKTIPEKHPNQVVIKFLAWTWPMRCNHLLLVWCNYTSYNFLPDKVHGFEYFRIPEQLNYFL